MTWEQCAHCGSVRQPSDLLAVTNVANSTRRFLCRPGEGGLCFTGSIRPRSVERIALAAPHTNAGSGPRKPHSAGSEAGPPLTRLAVTSPPPSTMKGQ